MTRTCTRRARFECSCTETQPGDSLLLVGGHPSLGHWNAEQGCLLITDETTFPKWSTQGSIEMSKGADPVEYKYLIRRRNGLISWETFTGNRSLTVPYENEDTIYKVDNVWCDKNIHIIQPLYKSPEDRILSPPIKNPSSPHTTPPIHDISEPCINNTEDINYIINNQSEPSLNGLIPGPQEQWELMKEGYIHDNRNQFDKKKFYTINYRLFRG
eukprot:GHVL01008953.1.p1 GENE.GHVL01008953.1~~GHVL01008953.1.p1  ORF type:complete len:214 (+),score=48.72 GHVL01008953.1:33-674(+)